MLLWYKHTSMILHLYLSVQVSRSSLAGWTGSGHRWGGSKNWHYIINFGQGFCCHDMTWNHCHVMSCHYTRVSCNTCGGKSCHEKLFSIKIGSGYEWLIYLFWYFAIKRICCRDYCHLMSWANDISSWYLFRETEHVEVGPAELVGSFKRYKWLLWCCTKSF